MKIFKHLNREYNNLYLNIISLSGLSVSEYWSLSLIADGVTSQADISRELFLPKQTINSAIKGLIQKNLVKIKRDFSNFRNKFCILTDSGFNFSKTYMGLMKKVENEVLYEMGEKEQNKLVSLFQIFNNKFKEKFHKYFNKFSK